MIYVQLQQDGRIMSAGNSYVPVEQLAPGLVEFPLSIPLNDVLNYAYDAVTDTFKLVGQQPSFYHEYDPATLSWVVSLTLVLESKTKDLLEQFSSKSMAPIAFDNHTLDADQTAQSNLKSKLQELDARIALNSPMPANQLFWKLADNSVVTFSTQESYHDWLRGYGIAMSERGTALYMAKWRHQAAIAALTTVADLQAYDVTIGW